MPAVIRPGMSDGRMTNWRSNCEMELDLMRKNGIATETEYRQALQNNPGTFDTQAKAMDAGFELYFGTSICPYAAAAQTFKPASLPARWK